MIPDIKKLITDPDYIYEPEILAFRCSWKMTCLEICLLILSGWMTCLAFPGFNISWLSWFTAVPLIAVCRGKTMKRAFLYGCVWGYFWNLGGCFFLREIMFPIPFVFGAVLGVFSGFFSVWIPLFFKVLGNSPEDRMADCRERREKQSLITKNALYIALCLSGTWVSFDWIRSWIFTGFPWGLFPASQWKNTVFIQICEITGIYGVDFLLILGNFAVYFFILDVIHLIRTKKIHISPVVIAEILLAAANIAFGVYSIRTWERNMPEKFGATLSAGIVQPDLSERRSATSSELEESLEICAKLSERLFQNSGDKPQVVIWPESAVPCFYYSTSEFSGRYRKQVREMMRRYNVPFVLGTMTYRAKDENNVNLYNSALLLKNKPFEYDNPFYDTEDVYSKVHLVPFGEYIPFNDVYPQIGQLVGMGRNLTPGDAFRPLAIGNGIYAGTVICYEDVFPYTTLSQARNGANFLLVITNDAWYPASFEPEQHCANSVFRAIETRLHMVRCGNSNYSVLIDPLGRMIQSANRGESDDSGIYERANKKTSCSAVFHVPLKTGKDETFYMGHTTLFIRLCLALFTIGIACSVFLNNLYKKKLYEPLEQAKVQNRR